MSERLRNRPDRREVAEALCSGSGDCEHPYCDCPRESEVVMSVRVPVELRDQLRECARQEERSMATVLRRAMRAYVRTYGRNRLAPEALMTRAPAPPPRADADGAETPDLLAALEVSVAEVQRGRADGGG